MAWHVSGKKIQPNSRNEYWVEIRESVDGELWVDSATTFYSDSWHISTRVRKEQQVDYVIEGNTVVMYIIDWGEIGYDRCKTVAFDYISGNTLVYRLD